MRMVGEQLRRILDQDDPLIEGNEPQQAREDGGLARAGTAGHDECEPCFDEGPEPGSPELVDAPHSDEVGQGECLPARHSKRDDGAVDGDRRDHCMQACSVDKACVDIGSGVIEPAPDRSGESLGEPANLAIGAESDSGSLEPLSAVDPHGIGTIHEDIGDIALLQEDLERPGADELAPQALDERQHRLIAEDDALGAER